ncbi:DUF6207 family protein [Streptomyces sp. CB01580]|uniref:DUF6207 family protein n=1 Tax=Streptomyces sp. CB01580 TaxID=1703933 RepID=UPI003FD224DB
MQSDVQHLAGPGLVVLDIAAADGEAAAFASELSDVLLNSCQLRLCLVASGGDGCHRTLGSHRLSSPAAASPWARKAAEGFRSPQRPRSATRAPVPCRA